jgi:DinB family protein
MTLHPQLQAIVSEFEQALARLHALAAELPEPAWAWRPGPERWSVGECIAHLNLTSAAYLPPLRAALRSETPMKPGSGLRYRRDPMGWVMWQMVGPTAWIRVKTTSRFIPQGGTPAKTLIADFERWQRDQIACVHEADGHDLNRLRIRSPFDPRVSYNAYACLTILPRHQHRHLWQAERACASLASRSG